MTTQRNVRLLRAGAVTGAGLVLALAATLDGPLSSGGAPGASLVIRLPETIKTLVLALLALSVLLLFAMQRPRRRTEDEPEPSPAPRRRSRWAPLVFLGLVLIGYLVWQRWSGADGHPIEAFAGISRLLELLTLPGKSPTSAPFFDATIAMLVVLVALATFALMLLITLAERLERWRAGRDAAEAGALHDAVAEGLDDLRAEPDARVAIVRAYRRFEHALSAADAPRAPWQTPSECKRATLARLPVPAPAVERLTALFEVARFSDRPLAAEARDAAYTCLDEIRTALQPDAAHAP